MRDNPRMRVMFASGYCDLATPYFATDYTIDHMNLTPQLRKNVTRKMYEGGHMLYHLRESMEKLKADVAAFVAQPRRRKRKSEVVYRSARASTGTDRACLNDPNLAGEHAMERARSRRRSRPMPSTPSHLPESVSPELPPITVTRLPISA